MNKAIQWLCLFFLAAAGLNISSCEQEDLDLYLDCQDCLNEVPDSADLIVYLTINDENPEVPLVFYRGDYEDGEVDWVDVSSESTLYLYSEVGQYYSVKATYQRDGESIIAVDGDKLRVVNGEDECYPPCYVIKGGTLDLRLK